MGRDGVRVTQKGYVPMMPSEVTFSAKPYGLTMLFFNALGF